jgi:Ca2+-binding EF-hand superfamily protein
MQGTTNTREKRD